MHQQELKGHSTAQCQFDLPLHPLMASHSQLLPGMIRFSTSMRRDGFPIGSSKEISQRNHRGSSFSSVSESTEIDKVFLRNTSEDAPVIMVQIYLTSLSDSIWELIKYLSRNPRCPPSPRTHSPKGIKHQGRERGRRR